METETELKILALFFWLSKKMLTFTSSQLLLFKKRKCFIHSMNFSTERSSFQVPKSLSLSLSLYLFAEACKKLDLAAS